MDGAWTDAEQKTLRTFVIDGRIVKLPRKQSKRHVVYRWLLEQLKRQLPEGQWLPETEISERIRPFHPDVATIRRELYEFGFLEREKNTYRRPPSAPPSDAG